MKRGTVIGLSVVGGVLVLLLASPFLIPASSFKAPIENAVADATGREFKINDGLRLTYWPVLGVDAKGVTLANAEGGKAQYFMQAENVAIGVAVAPLFKGDIQVKKLVVDKPAIALEANPGGKANWVFTPKTKPGEAQKPTQDKPVAVKEFGLSDVRIVDGALSFDDGKNPVRGFSDIDMAVKLESLEKPLAIDGDLTMNEQRLKLALGAAQPRAFLNKGLTPISVAIDGEVMKVALDGAMDVSTGEITGALKASGPSLRNLAAWAGSPMGVGNGFQAFDVAGQLAMKDKDIALSKAAIKIDAISGTGDLKINTSQTIPYVSGALNLGALDLNIYMPTPKGAAAPVAPASVVKGDKAAATAAKPGDQVSGRGVTVQAGWPKDPMDLSGLGKVNLDLALSTQKLLFQRYKIDSAKLNLHSAGGVMRADLNSLALYGGSGSGVVVLDASKAGRIAVAPKLSVQGLNANPFLIDAIGLDKIEGRGNLTLDLRGAGANTDQIMKSLGGAASFKFTDGAVKGINLAQIARTIQGGLSGQATGAGAKTDFAEMASTFTLRDGVATTSDFRLLNPYIRVTGKGDMNVGQQTFNMRIEPKIVKSGVGQGATDAGDGLAVPFKMTGPWAKPKFAPDLGDLIKMEAAKQLDKLLGKKADGTANTPADAISGLLSGFGKKKD